MARLDRVRLDTAHLPFFFEAQTRFDDLDVQGHVNNAAVSVLLQEARTRFNAALGIRALGQGRGLAVVAMTVEFAAELHHPEPVELRCGLLLLGRTSFTLGQIARQKGANAVYAEVTLVVTGPEGAVPIPDAMRAAFTEMMATWG